MSNYPKGSMGEQDAKSAKVFEWVCIVATIVVSVICYLVADNPFNIASRHPVLYILPVAYVVSLVIGIHNVLADKFWITESKGFYILMLLLFAASLVAMFAQPQQFGL